MERRNPELQHFQQIHIKNSVPRAAFWAEQLQVAIPGWLH
jgi:hypothetical protein